MWSPAALPKNRIAITSRGRGSSQNRFSQMPLTSHGMANERCKMRMNGIHAARTVLRIGRCCGLGGVLYIAPMVEAQSRHNHSSVTERGEFGWVHFPGFVMLPMLLLAIASGASNAGSVEYVSKWPHIAHTVLIAVPLWTCAEFCSRVAAKVLRPWRPAPVIPLIAGALLATQFNVFFSMFRNWALARYVAPGSHYFPIWPWNYGDPTYRMEAALTISQVIMFWLLMNLIFIHFLGFSRFASRTLFGHKASVEKPAPAAPVFKAKADIATQPQNLADPLLVRLPATIGHDIIALTGQGHYTQVFTRAGSSLVLMRFADAITAAEAVSSGSQVHRSHWVAHNAICGTEGNGETMVLCLSNGLKLPISRSYRLRMKELLSKH